MKRQWIVVANAAHARLFSRVLPSDPLIPLSVLEHPESRLKASELGDDRPGHEANDITPGGNRYEPRTDARRKEHQRFAHEISQRLDAGLAAGEFNTLVVYASSPFLGELKDQLSEAVQKHLQVTFDRDLTSFGLDEIERRLQDDLAENPSHQ
ncbi:MAG: host attachment protein [Pseudomonadota bacterium]